MSIGRPIRQEDSADVAKRIMASDALSNVKARGLLLLLCAHFGKGTLTIIEHDEPSDRAEDSL